MADGGIAAWSVSALGQDGRCWLDRPVAKWMARVMEGSGGLIDRHPCCSPAADAVAERRTLMHSITQMWSLPWRAVRVGLFAGRPQMRVVQIGDAQRKADSDGGRASPSKPRVQAILRASGGSRGNGTGAGRGCPESDATEPASTCSR